MKKLHRRSRPIRRTNVAALLTALVALLAAPLIVRAQPTSRPNFGGGGGVGGGGGAMNLADVRAAMEFAKEHMPHLARAIEESEPGQPRRKMMRFALERWRAIQRVQRESPGEYDAALERLASHDAVFDLVRQLNEAPPEQRAALRVQLREKMKEFMLDLLAEREARIENLRRMLGREEELLERDRANLDEMTEARIRMLQQELAGGGPPKSAGDLTPPDLSAPASPVEPSTAPSNDRPRRQR